MRQRRSWCPVLHSNQTTVFNDLFLADVVVAMETFCNNNYNNEYPANTAPSSNIAAVFDEFSTDVKIYFNI